MIKNEVAAVENNSNEENNLIQKKCHLTDFRPEFYSFLPGKISFLLSNFFLRLMKIQFPG